ncbi:MAG: hypothetical protein DHS20C08_19960 [Rhodomicrobium sp.]|nr:MAG: hypothetical protein DHS20C08_19960 [Rhodomicrobium sp.]
MGVELMSNFSEPITLRLLTLNASATNGLIQLSGSNLTFPACLGRTGKTASKREGDGKSPQGVWHPQQVYYRSDKLQRPITHLPIKPLKPNDGWCDDPDDKNYNRPVKRPYPASSEALWRQDNMYDLIVVLDHNQRPRVKNLGSAIFMHIAKPENSATEGCLAFSEPSLRRLIAKLSTTSRVII